MVEWLNTVEDLTQKGQISVPYTWWVGETGSRFLNEIRYEERITASKCDKCGTVYVPPRKNCGKCFIDIEKTLECGPEGTVTAYTIVRVDHPVYPARAPFAQALIRLDGADVAISHLIAGELEKIEIGTRVKPVFKNRSERTGHILDIRYFQPI